MSVKLREKENTRKIHYFFSEEAVEAIEIYSSLKGWI